MTMLTLLAAAKGLRAASEQDDARHQPFVVRRFGVERQQRGRRRRGGGDGHVCALLEIRLGHAAQAHLRQKRGALTA